MGVPKKIRPSRFVPRSTMSRDIVDFEILQIKKKKSQEENIDTEIIDQIGEASTSADFSEDHTIDSISDKNNDKEESEKLIRSTKDFDQNVNESEFPTQKIDFAIKRKIRGKSGSSKKQFHCERCEKSWWEWHHSFLLSRPHYTETRARNLEGTSFDMSAKKEE